MKPRLCALAAAVCVLASGCVHYLRAQVDASQSLAGEESHHAHAVVLQAENFASYQYWTIVRFNLAYFDFGRAAAEYLVKMADQLFDSSEVVVGQHFEMMRGRPYELSKNHKEVVIIDPVSIDAYSEGNFDFNISLKVSLLVFQNGRKVGEIVGWGNAAGDARSAYSVNDAGSTALEAALLSVRDQLHNMNFDVDVSQ